MSYLSTQRKLRVGYLSLTRGEGGQNLLGPVFGIPLGALREQELLQARRIDRATQFFSRTIDFGYSKGPEDTFQRWDKASVLADIVWVIRYWQPDVIVTRFPPTGEGGHGHHTVSAILAEQAFADASNKDKFPEQFPEVSPWQSKRLVWNDFRPWFDPSFIPKGNAGISIDSYNSVLGENALTAGAAARSMHKTQGFGTSHRSVPRKEYFWPRCGDTPGADPFSDLITTWQRFGAFDAATTILQSLTQNFDYTAPEKSVSDLCALFGETKKIADSVWRQRLQDEINSIIVNALSLSATARADRLEASPGDQITTIFECSVESAASFNKSIILNSVSLVNKTIQFDVDATTFQGRSAFITIPNEQPFSSPPYLVNERTEYHYSSTQAEGCLAYHPQLTVEFHFTINEHKLVHRVPLQFIYTDRVAGEVSENLRIEPDLSVKPFRSTLVLPNAAARQVEIGISAKKDFNDLHLSSFGQPDWTFAFAPDKFSIAAHTSISVRGSVASIGTASNGSSLLTVTSTQTSSSSTKELLSLPHVPTIQIIQPAKVKTVSFPLEVKVTDVGFIPGAGDETVLALTDMGLNVIEFKENLSLSLLKKVPVIISGVRAFNTNHAIAKYEDSIYEYVKEGGTFIAQYNTANTLTRELGPYPISLARARVTDENAKMTTLVADHPIFRAPNFISPPDWDGWVQERGLHFPVFWDKHYTPLLSCADHGEAPEKGSLLVANYGKGHYIYCSLSFFRQLPAGVPGAYRLLANLLSY